jgi:DNA-binding transcriptional regulator YdaS (Cro superfamily)
MLFQKLHKWQTEQGENDTTLAEKIGVHQTAISRAKRGLRVLGMEHQLAIQKVTGNHVLPADWAEFYALTMHLRPKKVSPTQKKSLAAESAA